MREQVRVNGHWQKGEHSGPVRGSCGLLELSQRGVALETLGESESSLGAEAVFAQTASMGAKVGAEACQGVADTKANTVGGGALELGDSRLFQHGSERGGALGSDVVVILE